MSLTPPSSHGGGAPGAPFKPAPAGTVDIVDDAAGTPKFQYTDGSGFDFADFVTFHGGVAFANTRLLQVGTPAGSTDAANKQYVVDQANGAQAGAVDQVSPVDLITSGALPTQQFVSGTAAQLVGRDVEVHTPVTFTSLVATIATCKVELSPDNTTFSTLCTWTEPVGVAFAGTIHDVTCRVPNGWWLKLTVAQATLGLSTYY